MVESVSFIYVRLINWVIPACCHQGTNLFNPIIARLSTHSLTPVKIFVSCLDSNAVSLLWILLVAAPLSYSSCTTEGVILANPCYDRFGSQLDWFDRCAVCLWQCSVPRRPTSVKENLIDSLYCEVLGHGHGLLTTSVRTLSFILSLRTLSSILKKVAQAQYCWLQCCQTNT